MLRYHFPARFSRSTLPAASLAGTSHYSNHPWGNWLTHRSSGVGVALFLRQERGWSTGRSPIHWDTHSSCPCCQGKLQRESQREKSAHIKKESAQQSHSYLRTPQTARAPMEPGEEEEEAFSCARTGFPALQPSGNEALPASPALSQGPHPGWPGDRELQHLQPLDWEKHGNGLETLWVDLIPSDFLFCELFPSLLMLFPLLNKYVSAWGMLFFIKQGRTSLFISLCSKSLKFKANRTQPSLGGDVNPTIQRPILNNKMGLWDTNRAVTPCSHPGWLIVTIKGHATTTTWHHCITSKLPSTAQSSIKIT